MNGCGDCTGLLMHIHSREYRDRHGMSHTVRTDGVCVTCHGQHPAPYSAQDNRDHTIGTLWRHDAVYAAELVAVTAGVAVGLRKENVT